MPTFNLCQEKSNQQGLRALTLQVHSTGSYWTWISVSFAFCFLDLVLFYTSLTWPCAHLPGLCQQSRPPSLGTSCPRLSLAVLRCATTAGGGGGVWWPRPWKSCWSRWTLCNTDVSIWTRVERVRMIVWFFVFCASTSQAARVFLLSCHFLTLVLEEDGTVVDSEEFFQSLPNNTLLMVLEEGQMWTKNKVKGTSPITGSVCIDYFSCVRFLKE